MAITEQTRIDTSIRLGGQNRLGCGHVHIPPAGSVAGDFVALQVLNGGFDTALSGIVGDSGASLTLPKETVGSIIYMNFTAITTTRDVLVYHRCR